MNHEILVTSFRNPCNSFISIQLGKMSSSTNNLNNQLKTLFSSFTRQQNGPQAYAQTPLAPGIISCEKCSRIRQLPDPKKKAKSFIKADNQSHSCRLIIPVPWILWVRKFLFPSSTAHLEVLKKFRFCFRKTNILQGTITYTCKKENHLLKSAGLKGICYMLASRRVTSLSWTYLVDHPCKWIGLWDPFQTAQLFGL